MEDNQMMPLAPVDVALVPPIASQDAVLVPPLTGVSVSVGTANSSSPSAAERSHHIGRTPPGTPPARLASPCSPHATHSEGSVDSGGSPHGKGLAAPTTAVDDIAEKFGRPRAHSFSRQDRHMSLPALDEEEDGLSAYGFRDDRRRAVSMSAMDEPRRWRPSREVIEVGEQCRDCRLAPCFAVKGERPSYCRAHKMVGMVSAQMESCGLRDCMKAASYGFHSEGRQRCFTHREPGMVHVLVASPEEDSADDDDIAPNC